MPRSGKQVFLHSNLIKRELSGALNFGNQLIELLRRNLTLRTQFLRIDRNYSGPEKLDSQLSYNQTDEKEKKNVHETTELQCGVQGKGSA
jgi:hypothetical protein